MAKLILNSKGLNTRIGSLQIGKELDVLTNNCTQEKSIFIVSFPEYYVDELIRDHCKNVLGILPENIFFSGYEVPDFSFVPDIVYVTEGNTFEVLDYMRKYKIVEYIKALFEDKKSSIYIGSSAGAIIAGKDILLANDFDKNFVRMNDDYTALGLFDGTIIPHYTPEELERYISYTDDLILRRYSRIYSVSNEEVLVIDYAD